MGSGQKGFVFEEVAKHKERNDCWLLISGKVYDVTPFFEEHPGGDEVLLAASGKDATDDFEDVGHSDDAKEMMEKYYIGAVDSSTVPVPKKFETQTSTVTHKYDASGFLMKILRLLVPLLILGLAFGLQFQGKKKKVKIRLLTFPIMEHSKRAHLLRISWVTAVFVVIFMTIVTNNIGLTCHSQSLALVSDPFC